MLVLEVLSCWSLVGEKLGAIRAGCARNGGGLRSLWGQVAVVVLMVENACASILVCARGRLWRSGWAIGTKGRKVLVLEDVSWWSWSASW